MTTVCGPPVVYIIHSLALCDSLFTNKTKENNAFISEIFLSYIK